MIPTRALAACVLATAALSGCGASGGTSTSPAPSSAAASVNGHTISMSDYKLQLAVDTAHSEDSLGYNACQVKGLDYLCKQIKQNALNSLIQRELLREYAARHHIVVPQRDVDAQWAIIYKNRFHDDPAVFQAFERHSHLTRTYFINSIRDGLYQNRVMYAVTAHMPNAVPSVRLAVVPYPSRALAARGAAALRAGKPLRSVVLAAAAVRFSQCKTSGCGDRGWVPLSLIPPDRSQLKSAPVGSVVGPLGLQEEFDVYLIEGRSKKAPLTSAQQYALRVQMFNSWLQKQQKQASVKRYVAT